MEGLTVAAPARATQQEIDAFVRQKARWIKRALAGAGKREHLLERQFVTGEGLPYRGESLLLYVVAEERARSRVELDGRRLEVRPPAVGASERRAAVVEAIEGWYRAQAKAVFAERVRCYAPQTGVEPKQIVVRAQKTRWGSCGKDGTLYFNWHLLIAPPPVLDYLVVHELCHLRQAGHGRRFWSHVARVMPDYPARRAELRRDGWRYRLV